MPVTRMKRRRMRETEPVNLFWLLLHVSKDAHTAATFIAACYRARYERKRVYSALGRNFQVVLQ